MSKIETFLPYRLKSYEEAAYLLARYFIERKYDADVIKRGEIEGAYSASVTRHGFAKNLLGSRTQFIATFIPDTQNGREGTSIEIEYLLFTDGAIKEIATYLLIVPAIKKLSDYAKMLNLCKKKSLEICEKLKIIK
ncbi:MAG: hypothetical protein GX304_06280 [Clostridiales bacterium]|jgi:hypothetical protein|nr:hypothetical protein [Clostridiales bacterium]